MFWSDWENLKTVGGLLAAATGVSLSLLWAAVAISRASRHATRPLKTQVKQEAKEWSKW